MTFPTQYTMCLGIHTVSRDNSSLCEKFDVYVGNVCGNNVKGNIANVVSSNNPVNELSQRLVRYCSVEDATLEGAVCCR